AAGSARGRGRRCAGAAEVRAVVGARTAELRRVITVGTPPRRSAGRFAAAGATVADIGGLAGCLATSDIAILATTASQPLIDARMLRSARAAGAGPLTVVDLSMPRNVDPAVRALPWVRLVDLADLRSDGLNGAGDLARALAATPAITPPPPLPHPPPLPAQP